MNLLFDDYYYQIIDEDEFIEILRKYRNDVFQENISFNVSSILSELEKKNLKNLASNMSNIFKLFIKITKNNETIGWLFGKQSDEESFRMITTGILKDHQNKGIYKELLKKVFEIIEKEGFQKIESRHHASNNQIIVPKLKAGFTVTGFEVEDKFGLVIKLTYFFNSKRKEITDFRIGSKKLNKEIEKNLDLWEKPN